MTREEYLQLVQRSEAFKAMDQALQQKMLKAEGSEMEKFAAVLQDERKLIYSAKKEMVDRNEQALKDMGTDMKKFEKDYLKTNEMNEKKNDDKNAEDLLKSM